MWPILQTEAIVKEPERRPKRKTRAHETGRRAPKNEAFREMYTLTTQDLTLVMRKITGVSDLPPKIKSGRGIEGRKDHNRNIHRSRELFLYTDQVQYPPMRVATCIRLSSRRPSVS